MLLILSFIAISKSRREDLSRIARSPQCPALNSYERSKLTFQQQQLGDGCVGNPCDASPWPRPLHFCRVVVLLRHTTHTTSEHTAPLRGDSKEQQTK